MNILFCMNHYPDSRNGGIENVTRILSEQFVKLGNTVHIRYLFDSKFAHSNDTIFESCEQIDKKNIGIQIHNAVKLHNIDFVINQGMMQYSPIIKNAISEFKCQLITAFHGQPTLNPPPIKDTIANPKISIIKKSILLLTYPLFVYRSRKKQKRRCQKSYYTSDYTVLLSRLHIQEYSKIMDIDTCKLTYFNNPIKDDLILQPQDLENKEKTILIVARLSEKEKCIIKSLEIWKQVVKSAPNWKLQIVGSGPDENILKEYVKKKSIKNVEFYPAQDPTEFYRKASIFLMTSRSEGWGCTLTEAMRLGCVPVAIGTYTAINDIIDNRENGIIIPKSSVCTEIRCCYETISTLIKERSILNYLAKNAHKKTEKYSAEVIAKQWIKLFEDCLLQN